MLRVGVIGIGSCGNQLASLATMEEFDTVAINSCELDLETVQDICNKTMLIGDAGCGKDRNRAKAFVKQKYKDFIKDLQEQFGSCDIVYIVGSTGGGTGSGMIPIVTDLLRSLVKGPVYVNSVAIPDIHESIMPQSNTLECIGEIKDLGLSYSIYDNGKTRKKSIKDIYEAVNLAFVEDIKVIRGDLCPASPYGNMDDRDRLKLVGTKGLFTVNRIDGIKDTHLDSSSVEDLIIKSIKESYNIDTRKDKIVKRMGFIYNLPEEFLPKLERGYEKVKEYVGTPLEIFEHINIVGPEENASIVTILAGLSYPYTRMEDINEIVTANKAAVMKVDKNDDVELRSSLDWLKDDSVIIEDIKKEPETNLDSIFNKY